MRSNWAWHQKIVQRFDLEKRYTSKKEQLQSHAKEVKIKFDKSRSITASTDVLESEKKEPYGYGLYGEKAAVKYAT